MDKLRGYPFVVLGLSVATYVASSGICLAQGGSPQAAPQPSTQNVNVVNQPTVNVGSMPAVTLSGTPAVSISGTPTVNSKDLDHPARQPVQRSVVLTIASGADFTYEPTGYYTVPPNKRLVIDTVSASVTVHTGENAAVWVAAGDVFMEEPEVDLYPALGPYMSRGSSGIWDAQGTTKVQAYANAGSAVRCYARRWPNSSMAGTDPVRCMWSGHLVDVQ